MPKENTHPRRRAAFLRNREQRRLRAPKLHHSAQPTGYLADTGEDVDVGSSQGSFFESSQNVQIVGGQFSTARGHHTNLTINLNQSGLDDSLDICQSRSTGRGAGHQQEMEVENPQQQLRVSEHAWLRPLPYPIQKSSSIYYRHLSVKGRGSPLWIPEPNNELPIAYRKKGIEIGDVGIITDYGGFDFLFNICVPEAQGTDSVNPPDMPEGFVSLNPPLRSIDVRGYSEFKADSYLASAFVKISQRDGDSSGLAFESSAAEGAILTMPHGSNSKDLGNIIRFRRYAFANAERWYRYVNEVRGREAKNGDVRLVVGYDKTTAWGMATFSDLSSTKEFRLKFKPTGERVLGREGQRSQKYGWEYSGMAEVRAGPDIHEIEQLRSGDDRHREEEPVMYENQCLFVRTLNVTLREDVWEKLRAESERLYLGEEDFGGYDAGSWGSGSSNPSFGTGGSGAGSGGGQRRSLDGSMMLMNTPNERVSYPAGQAVHISELPGALDVHPSTIINKLLLKEKPNARMAITEDRDWISVLEQNDGVLPSSEVLFVRILEMHDICEEEGFAFLRPKHSAHLSRCEASPVLSHNPTHTNPNPNTDAEERQRKLDRNRRAALRFRQRKKAELRELENKAEKLAEENQRLLDELVKSRDEIERLSMLVEDGSGRAKY